MRVEHYLIIFFFSFFKICLKNLVLFIRFLGNETFIFSINFVQELQNKNEVQKVKVKTTYHFFFLKKKKTLLDKYGISNAQDFVYLSYGNAFVVDGTNDNTDWKETRVRISVVFFKSN